MLKLNVPQMSCNHCKATIEKAVKQADPAARVDVDLTARTVSVESHLEEARIKDVIRSAGYDSEKVAA